MITMNGYDNINQILKYKGCNVYINEDDLELNSDEYLDTDIENFDVIVNDKVMGKVVRVERYATNNLIVVNNGVKDFLIPNVRDIILDVDLKQRCIVVADIKGLFD